MPQSIRVTFRDNYNEGTKQWAVVDQVCTNNVVWTGFLSYGESTNEVSICSDDGIYGCVIYQREDGAPTRVDNITDGSTVDMSYYLEGTIMADEELELPEFPGGVPNLIGDELALDGAQNICLGFCILWWNGVRWVPWTSLTFCAPSPEEIQNLVDFWIQKLAEMGFRCRAQQGDCPAG